MIVGLTIFVISLLAVQRVAYTDHWILMAVFIACSVMMLVAVQTIRSILAAGDGSPAMKAVSNPILAGAESFFRTQYTAIAKIAALVCVALLFLFLLRPASFDLSPLLMALLVSLSFLFGAACSAFAGFVGLWVAVRANVRVAHAATHSYNDAIQIALRGGACSGLAVVGLCTLGLTTLFALLRIVVEPLGISNAQVPHLMIGFTFGASFVALFAQLGGGIYTKAADVGADIVGKLDLGIPEDDPRNPAVIADLVGDNVGDCFVERDHQILTNRGFLYLADVERAVRCDARGSVVDWRGLQVATLEQNTQRLVFKTPNKLVVKSGVQELVEFTDGDISVVSTRGHELFVSSGASGAFCKRRAADVMASRDAALHFLAFDDADCGFRKPSAVRVGGDARAFSECGRTWCFDMSSAPQCNDGFVVVRRVRRVSPRDGVVLEASRPTVQGNCAGRGADLFESIAAEILGAMILGGQLATNADIDASGFLFFPLAIHALDCVVSSFGVMMVHTSSGPGGRNSSSSNGGNSGSGNNRGNAKIVFDEDDVVGSGSSGSGGVLNTSTLEDPLDVLKRGFAVASALSAMGLAALCYLLLQVPAAPNAWWHFLLCGYVGMASAVANLFIAQYYTDYKYAPVREIAQSSTTGHGTNIIAGISVGMRSTGYTVLTICFGVLASYALGASAIDGGGLFGTAVATMGMLSTAVYVLAMDTFGPIVDNAGGIAEMSHQPEHVRMLTDRLDGSGNVTKAATKGYAIGSAGLAAFLLFSAFSDVIAEYAGRPFGVIDFSRPEVFVGGMVGAALVFTFSGLTIRAVGDAAGAVVVEVRRQIAERPGIMQSRQLPDYGECVRIVTEAALAEMVLPGLLVTATPAVLGFFFKFVGIWTAQDLLGPTVVAGFLVSATTVGIVVGIFLNNAGGAWDNAKKYLELGAHGGKGSEAHKAAVTGDTVGDPCKDTAGPSLHVLIKLVSTVALVIGPAIIN
jgi:Na+/H+-translocating membrane pyrophosphatase